LRSKPYLTKLWFGRWWVYIDTNRKYKYRCRKLGFYTGIVSYKKTHFGEDLA
jgi:hypothetical protein